MYQESLPRCACIQIADRFTHYAFFFFNDTATTEIYTLSLHDALPICVTLLVRVVRHFVEFRFRRGNEFVSSGADRKSTRLNSSHSQISYAVFCLKKKNTILSPEFSIIRNVCHVLFGYVLFIITDSL